MTDNKIETEPNKKEYYKQYREKNKDKIKKYTNEFYENNINYNKEYYEKNKQKIQGYLKCDICEGKYKYSNKNKQILLIFHILYNMYVCQ